MMAIHQYNICLLIIGGPVTFNLKLKARQDSPRLEVQASVKKGPRPARGQIGRVDDGRCDAVEIGMSVCGHDPVRHVAATTDRTSASAVLISSSFDAARTCSICSL